MIDIAWEKGDGKTNSKLKNGDRVLLLYNTVCDRREHLSGCVGTVVEARTPKVTQSKRGSSPYFANVDLDSGQRIRVPHGALKILREILQ